MNTRISPALWIFAAICAVGWTANAIAYTHHKARADALGATVAELRERADALDAALAALRSSACRAQTYFVSREVRSEIPDAEAVVLLHELRASIDASRSVTP